MNPIYSQFGQLVGWLSGNVIFGANGKNVAFVRNDIVYSYKEEYRGKLVYDRGKIIWVE